MNSAIFCFVDEIESTFVFNDLIQVAGKYQFVYLFSIEKLEGKERLPANVILFEDFINWEDFRPFNLVIRHLFSISGIYVLECLAQKKILPLKASITILVSNIFKANEIQRRINESSLSLKASISPFYSFWFYDCIYLAWLKKTGFINTALTRAHSGDLYEDHISIRNKILFRNFQMRHLDAVFPVSDMGTSYLKEKYVDTKVKIKTIFLGSPDPMVLNPFDNKHFTIVSCASFRHHKRIHKIAEALLHVNIPLTWHHFGNENLDGDDPKIKEYIMRKQELQSKSNIQFIPHGSVSNEKLFEFYKNHQVNLFISLSAAEGIPVSIMEAISFGIPVLSTDVGGCREIVTEQTGILVPLETKIHEIAQMISAFNNSTKNTVEFRHGVRKFWELNFNQNINYQKFFQNMDKNITGSNDFA